MVKSVVGIPAAANSDLFQVLPKTSFGKTSLTEGEKEAILVVLLGLLLSLKGNLTEKIIEDATDSELRALLSPVKASLQLSAFSWLLNITKVRELLLSEFKKKKEAEEREKRQKEARAKLRSGVKFTKQELLTLLHEAEINYHLLSVDTLVFTLDTSNITFTFRDGFFVRKPVTKNIKENKMGKKFALRNSVDWKKWRELVWEKADKLGFDYTAVPGGTDSVSDAMDGWTSSTGVAGKTEEDLAAEFVKEQMKRFSVKNSKEKNMRKFAINSARGEVSDSTRQLVRDILDQVPALVKVPEKQQGIKKEPYGPDHVCYFYTEEGPRKGSYVTVEFHVDPSDLYTDIFITTRASFAAAADGGEARQDEREITLDEFVIEDLEDYSLADIDKIDAAVTKGFEGAQKFDEQAASTIESRKALFSSKHKQFVASGKARAINSDASWQKYVQQIMDEEGLTREEAEEEAARRQAYC